MQAAHDTNNSIKLKLWYIKSSTIYKQNYIIYNVITQKLKKIILDSQNGKGRLNFIALIVVVLPVNLKEKFYTTEHQEIHIKHNQTCSLHNLHVVGYQ